MIVWSPNKRQAIYGTNDDLFTDAYMHSSASMIKLIGTLEILNEILDMNFWN